MILRENKVLYSTQMKTTSSIKLQYHYVNILFRHFRLLFETACLLSGDSPHGQLKVTRLWSLDLKCQRVADSWSITLILGILTMQPFLRKHYSIPQDPVSDQNIFMSGPGVTLSFATRFIFATIFLRFINFIFFYIILISNNNNCISVNIKGTGNLNC